MMKTVPQACNCSFCRKYAKKAPLIDSDPLVVSQVSEEEIEERRWQTETNMSHFTTIDPDDLPEPENHDFEISE